MKAQPLIIVYLPDTRGVELSHYGKGNLKIGLGVFTYSRLPGKPPYSALGLRHRNPEGFEEPLESDGSRGWAGTCPGATEECQSICYAARPVAELGPVATMWLRNAGPKVPSIPAEAKLLRLHVSGDFDSIEYIDNWILNLVARPDVQTWGYTRSWRVPELLPALERLRALPNVQLWASMDSSTRELPPLDWRRAWIDGDPRAGVPQDFPANWGEGQEVSAHNQNTFDGRPSYICPEETGRRANCEECGYCITGRRNDVTFLKH